MNKANLPYSFGLSTREMDTVMDILSRFPEINLVHVFGSRAKGNANSGSDLDLALMNQGISFKTICDLQAAFEESSLPFRVDVVKFSDLPEEGLRDHILRRGQLLYRAALVG